MIHVKKSLGDRFKGIDRPYLRRDPVAAQEGKNVRHGLPGRIVGEKACQINPIGDFFNGVKAIQGINAAEYTCVADNAALFNIAQSVTERFGPYQFQSFGDAGKATGQCSGIQDDLVCPFSKGSFRSL